MFTCNKKLFPILEENNFIKIHRKNKYPKIIKNTGLGCTLCGYIILTPDKSCYYNLCEYCFQKIKKIKN